MHNSNYIKTIFSNNKPLIFTNSGEHYILKYTHAAHFLFLSGATPNNLRMALKHLSQSNNWGVIIEENDMSQLDALLTDQFTTIHAGGGVVTNREAAILMIFRRGKWDLPKGKLDDGETIEDCAIREVKEETGLKNLNILSKIGNTYHIYDQNNSLILKDTHWYHMSSDVEEELSPQIEENITEVKWINSQKMDIYLMQSYEGIRLIYKLFEKHQEL